MIGRIRIRILSAE